MNSFLEHLSTRVDATAADLKTSLHEHVDSTVDSRLDTFKVELASLARSAVVECIRTEGRYQHWRVETTYTPVSAHSQHHSGDVRLMPNHSTSYIEGIPPPLLTREEASNSSTSQCIADVTFPSGHSVSIPLYNAQPTHHQLFPSSMHSSLLSNDNLDTTEQDNTLAQSAQTNNNQQISHEPFQTNNPASLLPIASTSAAVSDGLLSTNSVPSESPLNVSTHTVQLSDHIKREHLDEQSHNGHHQQMDSDDRGQSRPFKSQRMGPVCNCPHPPKRTVLPEVKEEEEEEEDTSKMTSAKDTQLVVSKVKEEEDEDDQDDGVIRGGDHSQVDDERYEVTQPNVDCGQLLSNPSRDRKNDSNANESIEEGGTNLSSQQLLNTANQSDDQTVTQSSGDLLSPSTSTGLGSNRTALNQQTTASTDRNGNKRKQSTSNQTAKRSKKTLQEEDGDDGEDISNEDREEAKVKVLYLNCTDSNCNVKLDSLDHLHDHLSTVHQLAPLRCFATNCNARFDNPRQIGDHIKLSHSRSTRFDCSVCHKECDSQGKANRHWYQNHQTGQYQCNLVSDCGQVSDTRGKMTNHQNTKHRSQSKHFH